MYIMFRSVLFLALVETTLSFSGNLPQICEQATTFTCEPKERIPWTECGGEYLPECDATRCCTDKHIEVTWNDTTIAKVLASDGDVHIDARNAAKTSLLMFAVSRDNMERASVLIDQRASVNLKNEHGQTALMFASRGGNSILVKMLVVANASLDATDYSDKNAMMYASNAGRISVIELLLDYCAEVGQKELDNIEAGDATAKERLLQAQKNPLIAAVLRESEGGLKHILQNQDSCLNGVSINSTETIDGEEWTALTYATDKNRLELVEILLERNAKIGTELLLAARKGYVEIGKKLAAEGADVDDDAIVTAVKHNHTTFVGFLLDNRASVDARNAKGEPVLFVAAAKNNADIVLRLIQKGASISATNCSDNALTTRCEDSSVCDTALTLAMKKGYGNVAAGLLSGANRLGTDQVLCVDGQTYSPLTWASKYEEAEIVSSLLTKCADIGFETDEKTSLEIAQDNKNTDIIAKLEAAKWPYITAIKDDTVQSLNPFEGDVCNRSHVNETKEGRSPLMLAVDSVKEKIVVELIELNADVNAKNDGQTALMLAAIKNNAIVESLLQSPEIEVNAQGKDGRSALMIAAESCFAENVKSFVADGRIDIDAADNEKQTALMHAVRCSSDVVQSLLEKRANVGARGDQGRTAFMQAVDHCNAPVVSVLLEKGNANLSMRYEDTETVLMHAVKECNVNVVNHLKNHSSEEQINMYIKEGIEKQRVANALMIAVEKNRSFDIIKSLLSHPKVSVAPTPRLSDSALVRAVKKNRTDIVWRLARRMAGKTYTNSLQRDTEYNDTVTVIGIALQENANVDIVKILLDPPYYAYADHRFTRGLSMTGRNPKIVELIQDARWPELKKIEDGIWGINVQTAVIGRNRFNWMYPDECMSFFEPRTMYMAAAKANNTDAMERLLRLDKKHRYIDRTCDTGETPLCIAARKNHVEIAKLLLNECPDVDLRCDKRNYKKGIAREKMNTYGKSALEIAKEMGHSEIAEEIRYKKWILLGKIARNGAKSVKELRKEHLEGGHKCDATPAKRSYELHPSQRCDRGETVKEWAIRYGREDILAEVAAAFPSFTAPLTTTTVTPAPAPGSTTSTDPKDGDDDDFPWEYLGFVAIIPVCIGIAYAVWRYYPTPTVQASKMPSNMAVATEIPRNVANIKKP